MYYPIYRRRQRTVLLFFIYWLGICWCWVGRVEAQNAPNKKRKETPAPTPKNKQPTSDVPKSINELKDSKSVGIENDNAKRISTTKRLTLGVVRCLVIQHLRGNVRIAEGEGEELVLDFLPQKNDILHLNPDDYLKFTTDTIYVHTNTEAIAEADPFDLSIELPKRANVHLQIQIAEQGNIEVKRARQRVEAYTTQGTIVLTDLEGWAVAQTEQGDIWASFRQVAARQPISLVTLNGTVNTTLPPDTEAQWRIQSNTNQVENQFAFLAPDSLRVIESQSNIRRYEPSQVVTTHRRDTLSTDKPKGEAKKDRPESRARAGERAATNLKTSYRPAYTTKSGSQQSQAPVYFISARNGRISIKKNKQR